MTSSQGTGRSLAGAAAVALAIDPVGLGGATLRGPPGPVRDAWLDRFRSLLPGEGPWRRLPPNIDDHRLLGGVDLAATLSAGRPVRQRGLLAEAAGGVLVVPMAERLADRTAGPLGAAIDAARPPSDGDAGFTLLLLDEGQDDERAPAALTERLAFIVDVDVDGVDAALALDVGRDAIAAARGRLASVAIDAPMLEAICAMGLAFGVPSLLMAQFAVRAAKAFAALAGREEVVAEDAERAVALAVAPRATMLPAAGDAAPEEADRQEPDQPIEGRDATPPEDEYGLPESGAAAAERLVEATTAAIPAGLLAALSAAAAGPTVRRASAGRAGVSRASWRRGRPAGVRRGLPREGARLAIVDTLRAAAPWQAVRRAAGGNPAMRILVHRDDFRVVRYEETSETTIVFVVDASGSAAFQRLAEVKGAVELLLADCYSRRDRVALIAFRETRAELILPPTRSLTRAKRALAGQIGGGATPLATAIDAAVLLAETVRRKGSTPLVVLMTDGRANIGRSGRPGRAEADADAAKAATSFRAASLPSILIDIAPRPQAMARQLASIMGARYEPLPSVDARALSQAVLATSTPRSQVPMRHPAPQAIGPKALAP